MRRSINYLLALVLTLAVILPVTADHRMLDQQGRLWSTSQQGVESAWIVWETEAPVQRLAVDGDDIWVGTYGGGLGRWDRTHGFQESFTSGAGLPGSDVTGIAHDGSGNLWVTLLDGSVARSSDGSSFSNITPPAPADRNAWTVAARGSNIWVGTLGGGVAQRAGGWTLHSQSDGLPFNDIYAIGLESNGTPWVGTMGYGIAAYQGGAWVAYAPPLEIANPLDPALSVPNRAITDIAVDAAGVKWFGTDGSGVVSLDGGNTNWTLYNHANSGLCGDFVQTIHLDPSDNLWFGTLGGGVCRLSADRSSWTTYDSNSTPLPEDDILDVALDTQGGLWLAAYDVGLAYFGALPDPAPSFDIDPRGVPTLDGTGSHGYWLWLDTETFEWTLAWTGGAGSHQFEGSLQAPDGLNLVGTQGLEAGDQVEVAGETLVVDASEGAGWDQVTFALVDLGVEELTVALRIDGAFYPYRIHLGGSEDLPGTAPFRITAPQPQPPMVQAGDDLVISEGSYAFLSASYQDPDSPGGHTLQWDFGDDSPIEESLSASHLYVEDGVYTATFTVTDVHGLIGQDTLLVTVENVPPVVDFSADPFFPFVGQEVMFKAILFDPGTADTHTLTWEFGDGTDPVETQDLTITHTFAAEGEYPVMLTVTDDDGGVGSVSFLMTVEGNAPPFLSIPEPVEALEGELIMIPMSFSDPDSSSWTTIVDYGDDTVPEEMLLDAEGEFNLEHIYTDDGVYTVVVTITDDQGAAAEGSFDVTVENVAPEAILSADPTINEGDLLNLAGEIIDPGEDTWSIAVDWGDGSELADITPVERMFTLEHLYVDDGAYTLEVCVEDDDLGTGCSAIQVTVENVAPVVVPGPKASGEEGAQIAVTATFSDPGVLDTHTASVVWGDGTSSPADIATDQQGWQVTASHPYGQDGVYTIEICVTDDDGGSGCGALQVSVSNVAPSVEAGSDWQVDEGELVDLSGASFNDPGFDETYTAQVYWGYGTTEDVLVDQDSHKLTKAHTYADDGIYQVVVTVDDGIDTDDDSFTVEVQNVAPTVDAGDDQTLGEGGAFDLTASFSDPGSADKHTATIIWGDGMAEPGSIVEASVEGSHTYPDEGTYQLKVCVVDDDGGEGCDSFMLTVENLPPVVAPGGDIAVDQAQEFTAELASFTDPGAHDTHTATVDWGDGTVEPGQVDQAAGIVSGSHLYLDPGTYTITIEVCDDGSACVVVSLKVEVQATPEGGIEVIKAVILEYISQDEIDLRAKNSMFSKLDAALKSLEKGKDHTAVNQLGAFINYLEAQSGKKVSESAAEDLIAQTEAIIDQIEDGNNGEPQETLTTLEGIEALKAAILDSIARGEIDPKAETSMFSKMDAALKSLEKGNDHTAVNQLGAFINYVEAQRDKKILEAVADDLIARAEAVISLIEAGAATFPRGLFDLA